MLPWVLLTASLTVNCAVTFQWFVNRRSQPPSSPDQALLLLSESHAGDVERLSDLIQHQSDLLVSRDPMTFQAIRATPAFEALTSISDTPLPDEEVTYDLSDSDLPPEWDVFANDDVVAFPVA
jgi:hypothetical protein